MFTGIVQGIGRIERVQPRAEGLRIVVDFTGVGAADAALGDSIALNGCCLTVVERNGEQLAFDVSQATLACTTGLDRAGRVNVEPALRAGDRLGGHLVSGHVDAVGTVRACVAVADGTGSYTLTVEAPQQLARFIAAKGSIAVDGVSLTVNTVEGARFTVNLIPHTLAVTTLAQLAPGAMVNLEVDLMARYAARLLEAQDRPSTEEPWN
jgi:riboflavin synthase